MKVQNNPNKSKYCQWYKNKTSLNNLCHHLNDKVQEFEQKHGVKVVIKTDLDRTIYFEKVFFEETKSVEV